MVEKNRKTSTPKAPGHGADLDLEDAENIWGGLDPHR